MCSLEYEPFSLVQEMMFYMFFSDVIKKKKKVCFREVNIWRKTEFPVWHSVNQPILKPVFFSPKTIYISSKIDFFLKNNVLTFDSLQK